MVTSPWLARTTPHTQAFNPRIRANRVPPRGFVQEACTRKAAMACGEAIVCAGPSGTGFFLCSMPVRGWLARAMLPVLPTIPGRRETKGNLNFSSCQPRGQLPGLVAGAARLVVAGAVGGKRSLGMGLISILARFRSSVSRFF